MIPSRVTLLSLFLSAAPALACGNGECDPPPPPPPPPPVVVDPPAPLPGPRRQDRDPAVATPVIHYGYCCQIDGTMVVSTAWLRDPVVAHEQCRARAERLQSLPSCPRRIQRREGGE